MQRYILTRVVQAIVTLLLLSLAIFLSVHVTGDPATYLLGPEGTRDDYEQLKKNLGLDRPSVSICSMWLIGSGSVEKS